MRCDDRYRQKRGEEGQCELTAIIERISRRKLVLVEDEFERQI